MFIGTSMIKLTLMPRSFPQFVGMRHIAKATTVIAERSEANNRDLWASESQLAFTSVRHAFLASGPGASHVFKMATPTVTWMPSSNSWRRKRQRSGQVYCIVLSSKAYYTSQVNRVCVALL